MLYKKCRICGESKEIIEFHKKKDTPDGVRNECKECVKEIQKKYKNAEGFKEKQKAYDKAHYNENRKEILEYKKVYHIENKKEILKKKAEYRKENQDKIIKWRNNNKDRNVIGQANYRINNPHCVAWRSVLYSTLKRLGTKKQGHTVDLLGYSALELKEHIEKQFTDGMTWKNYGEWQIDHIIGVINFDKNTDVSIVCALENLRPLWATTREINGIIYDGNLNKPKYQ